MSKFNVRYLGLALRSLIDKPVYSIIDGEFSWLDARLKPTDEEISSKITELEKGEPMRLLREERDKRIAETDWWVLPDRTASQEQLDYRQELRDLPSAASPELDEQGNLTNVTWPTKPE